LVLDMVAWEPGARISAAEVIRRLDSPVFFSAAEGAAS
jgi:hypothetical protein